MELGSFNKKKKEWKQISDKKFYTLEELLTFIPMSKAGLYKVVSEGKIPSIKIGRRVLIPAWWVEELTSKPQAAAVVAAR